MANKFVDTNLNVYRGDRESYKFTVTSGGTPLDLSGHTITAQGRDDEDSVTTNFSFTITDSVDGNDHANGIVVLVLPTTVTENLPEKSRYDIQAVLGVDKFTIVKGRLVLTKDVTRP